MKLISLAFAAFMAGSAYAQSQCVITCSTQAQLATPGCTSFADPSCVCQSATFQNLAGACLLANCTSAEQQQGAQLQAALCGSTTASGSVSVRLSSATGSTALPSGSSASALVSSAVASVSGSASGSTSRPASSSGASSSGGVASSASSVVAAASSSRAAGEKGAELKMGSMVIGGLVGVLGLAVGGLAVL